MLDKYSLKGKEAAQLIGNLFTTLGVTLNVGAPGPGTIPGLLSIVLGEGIKGISSLINVIEKKKLVDKLKMPSQKAYLLIYLSFFKAFEGFIKERIPNFDDKTKKFSASKESLLNSNIKSIEDKFYSLIDFEKDSPEKSEIFKSLKRSGNILLLDESFCDSENVRALFQSEIKERFIDSYADLSCLNEFDEAKKFIDAIPDFYGDKRFINQLKQKAACLGGELIYDDFILDQLFVSPTYGIYKHGRNRSSKEPEWENEDLFDGIEKQFAKGNNVCVITADMGMGKSSFCRIYASKIAKENKRIPIFIELKKFTIRESKEENDRIFKSIKEYIENEYQIFDFKKEAFFKNKFLIIFDGLDEVPELGIGCRKVEKVLDFLSEFSKNKNIDARIIITSRPAVLSLNIYEEINDKRYPLLEIGKFDEDRINLWLENWFSKVHPIDIPKNFNYDYSHIPDENIKEEIRVPLLLYMLNKVFQETQVDPKKALESGELKRLDIYQRFIDWTIRKAKYQKADLDRNLPKEYRRLIGEIAYAIFVKEEGGQIRRKDLQRMLPKKLRKTEEMLNRNRCIALAYFDYNVNYTGKSGSGVDIEEHYEFQHKSFREYFAAERVISVFLRALNEDYEDIQDEYRLLLGMKIPTEEKFNFIFGLLEQLKLVGEMDEDEIERCISNKTGAPWRFCSISCSNKIDFSNIHKKVYNIACRWLDNRRPLMPIIDVNEQLISIEDVQGYSWDKPVFFAQNVQLTSFLIAAHINRICDNMELMPVNSRFFKFWNSYHHSALLSTNLHNIDLSGLYGFEMCLNDCCLVNSIIRDSDLIMADFSYSNAQAVNFEFSRLQGVTFKGANLQYSNFKNVDFSSISIRHFNTKEKPEELCSDFSFSNLQYSDFTGMKFNIEDPPNFRNADIEGTRFSMNVRELLKEQKVDISKTIFV